MVFEKKVVSLHNPRLVVFIPEVFKKRKTKKLESPRMWFVVPLDFESNPFDI